MTAENMARIAAVRAALDQVSDPELDESVVQLGFITGIDVDGSAVEVRFRLPTYWCAANFSYLMASDMRDAVAAIGWVQTVSVRLDDHMFVETINEGIAGNKDFTEAFPSESATGLAGIRLTFGLKSFERRQEALLRHLLARGYLVEIILELDIAGLQRLALDPDGTALRKRYVERRGLAGAGPLAFVTRNGVAISEETLATYLRNLRRVGLNAEFNGALCRGLLAVRYGAEPHTLPPEPELIDFLRRG